MDMKMKSNRRTANTSQKMQSVSRLRPLPLPEQNRERLFHCQAAFLALVGVGAGEEEFMEGEWMIESRRLQPFGAPLPFRAALNQ